MVEAITKLTASSFCLTVRAPGLQEGGKEGLRAARGWGHRPLLLPLPPRQKKGSEEPDGLRVKGGMSDQAGRHLAFSEASITHMFFPDCRKTQPFYFICQFTIPQASPLFAYFTYTREEDTGVCKQTDGEYIVL